MRRQILCLVLTCLLGWSQEPELRGTWFAWAGADVPTKAGITETMEALAASNINLVYFDVWRYGFPYYRSQIFEELTGLETDPSLQEGRDILMEAVAEAHRVGLQIEAWFEFGFVASVGNNDHIWEAHPEWFAKKVNGSTDFDNGFKWLSHCNRDAQQFLIGLCTEVARNYDVDGIELDRIRYPGLNCGYDSATVALYASEHAGADPPTYSADPEWMSWRAQKLTDFMAECYDSVKAVNPDLMVSNAPIVYPYGYSNFCQDWRPWINEGHLDNVAPQVYRATNSSYVYDLDIQLAYVNDPSLVYPGITTMVNTEMVALNEFLAMIQSTRDRGLEGHVIWYHLPLLTSYAEALLEGPYAEPASVPGRPDDWRLPAIVVSETDPGVTLTGNWSTYSTKGFDGSCLYSLAADQGSEIAYRTDIPQNGWYEVYLYINSLWNAAQDASVTLHHVDGSTSYRIDQSQIGLERWYKLDDMFLEAGNDQLVLSMLNDISGGAFIFADAIMLLKSNQVGLTAPVSVREAALQLPENRLACHPNPFNGWLQIHLEQPEGAQRELHIFDLQGHHVRRIKGWSEQGGLSWQWNGVDEQGRALPSGLYLLQASGQQHVFINKVLLLK